MTSKIKRQDSSVLFPDYLWSLPSSPSGTKYTLGVVSTAKDIASSLALLKGALIRPIKVKLALPMAVELELASLLPPEVVLLSSTDLGTIPDTELILIGPAQTKQSQLGAVIKQIVSEGKAKLVLVNQPWGETEVPVLVRIFDVTAAARALGWQESRIESVPPQAAEELFAKGLSMVVMLVSKTALVVASEHSIILTPLPVPLKPTQLAELYGLIGALVAENSEKAFEAVATACFVSAQASSHQLELSMALRTLL